LLADPIAERRGESQIVCEFEFTEPTPKTLDISHKVLCGMGIFVARIFSCHISLFFFVCIGLFYFFF